MYKRQRQELSNKYLLAKLASIQPRTSPSKFGGKFNSIFTSLLSPCLLYTSDAADEEDSVDLGESFPTSIYLQKSASIQPRTSPSKFGGKYSILFTGVLTTEKRERSVSLNALHSSHLAHVLALQVARGTAGNPI